MNKLTSYFKRGARRINEKNKKFEALQIEISSLCNLKCNFCPTTYLNEKEENMLMPWETFLRIKPYFSQAKWIYLQGWGEPLLNPKIWEMVDIIKKEKSQVGFTTNGTLLSNKVITNLLEYQVELVSISIAGATSQGHEKLRVKSNFLNIINNIRALAEEKERRKIKKPLLSISYMLTKESIVELPQAVRLAYELGADDFYTTNLDYVFNKESNMSKIFVWEKNQINDCYEKYIKEAAEFARKKEFSFRTYPLRPIEEQAVCDLNPAKLVFITSNGDVTPCTYLGRKSNPRYFKDEYFHYPRKVFGNINEQDFSEIWQGQEYKEFREKFEKRVQAYRELLSVYTDFEPNLSKIKNAQAKYYRSLKENPLPIECQSCPKILGI